MGRARGSSMRVINFSRPERPRHRCVIAARAAKITPNGGGRAERRCNRGPHWCTGPRREAAPRRCVVRAWSVVHACGALARGADAQAETAHCDPRPSRRQRAEPSCHAAPVQALRQRRTGPLPPHHRAHAHTAAPVAMVAQLSRPSHTRVESAAAVQLRSHTSMRRAGRRACCCDIGTDPSCRARLATDR